MGRSHAVYRFWGCGPFRASQVSEVSFFSRGELAEDGDGGSTRWQAAENDWRSWQAACCAGFQISIAKPSVSDSNSVPVFDSERWSEEEVFRVSSARPLLITEGQAAEL